MDKSIPYVGVLMTKDDPRVYPRHDLPAGYSCSFYQPGQDNEWAELQVQTGQVQTLEAGRAYFAKEYLSDPDKVTRQLFFIRDQALGWQLIMEKIGNWEAKRREQP